MSVGLASWRDLFSSQVYSAVLLPIFTIVLMLIVDEVQGVVGLWMTVACFVVSYVMCVASVFLVVRLYVRPIERAVQDLGDKISRVSTGVASGCGDWVVDNEYLISVERRESIEEVWVVSTNISSDIDGGSSPGWSEITCVAA